MNILLIYHSKKGHTKRLAFSIGTFCQKRNHQVKILSLEEAGKENIYAFDLIGFGHWTKGKFLMFQRPEKEWERYVRSLPPLHKPVFFFTSYNIYIGSMFSNMEKMLSAKQIFPLGYIKARRGKFSSKVQKDLSEILNLL